MTGADRFLLLCNERYGAPFEAAFRRWCRERAVSRFLVVRSLRGMPRRRLAVRVGNRLRAALGSGTVQAEDVNAPDFAARYLPRSGRLFGVVAGFNQIFAPPTIARFHRLYNFHPSLLPYYRGPVPSYWCLQNGETTTGITLHEVAPEIDRGRVLWQEAVAIETTDPDALDLSLARLGAAILPELLDGLREGGPLPARVLPAERLYRKHVDYASFPGSKSRA
jgi:methionyl-tRNA formyltransferase